MGIGFTSGTAPEKAPAAILASMRDRAQRRNREMLARINLHLAPVSVDYDRDVVPMTPSGNVTERHMLLAIHAVSDWANQRISESANSAPRTTHHASRTTEIAFWSDKLSLPADQIASAIDDAPNMASAKFLTLVRGKLMKKGSVGYVMPTPAAYPTVDEVDAGTRGCAALPCATWLDGMSAGEQAIHELLGLLIDKGSVALNIVPDRNWNIADPEMRQRKVAKLHEIVRIAAEYDLPLNVGTEMNAPGNRLIDDFDVPEMAPLRQAALDGAAFVYGHTVMQRALGLGYQSAWAAVHLSSRRARNAFYTEIGRRVPPGAAGLARLGRARPGADA